MTRKRILYLIQSLGCGGAQKVLINLVNCMNCDRYEITVETMFGAGVNRKKLPPHVTFINKNKLHIRGLSKLIRFIPADMLYRYYIGSRKYDILVAYLEGEPVKVLSGCPDRSVKRIVWLHNGYPGNGAFFRFWKNEETAIKAYAGFEAIVGVSEDVSQSFEQYTGIDRKKIITLRNIYDTDRICKEMNESISFRLPEKRPLICAVGRLAKEKGFDRLIKVCATLIREGYGFSLIIIGRGPEKRRLQKLVNAYKLEQYIHFTGYLENPYSVMTMCDWYVLASLKEGVATVLVEALCTSLPIVATDVSGTWEVLGRDSEYGLVVESSEKGLYQGMKCFLDNPELRKQYRLKTAEAVRRFTAVTTVKEIEGLFESLS